jgi:16S rRNA (adenine1518-N6/adenine1519-N6)-dimethyltransferase
MSEHAHKSQKYTKMGITAKKRFGQNFLRDDEVLTRISKIVDSVLAYDQTPRHIIEIGPGTGQLTRILATKNTSLTALEIDTEALDYLKTLQELEPADPQYLPANSIIINADALSASYDSKGIFVQPYFLVANLPFNVGSRILVNLGVTNPNGNPLVVILQKEVATKALRSASFTLFGAWLNLFWNMKIASGISRSSYSPPPDVATSILVGTPKVFDEFWHMREHREAALALLKILTAHPRKAVRSNLKYGGWSQKSIDEVFGMYSWEATLRLEWDNYDTILLRLLDYNREAD